MISSFGRPFILRNWLDYRAEGTVSFFFATLEELGGSYLRRVMVSASEDLADVEKVLAGDISAFEGIVRRWQGPLINLAFRFCPDRGRAEEIAQDAFLRAYRGLDKWRKEAAFSTWLFALAANVCRSELRRIPLDAVSLDDIAEPRDQRSADGGLEEEDLAQSIRRAVSALPPKYRETMILFYFHEMDIPAASRSLGLPEGTVKARLFRAREILRNKLSQWLTVQRLKEETCERRT
jgi:RNA polymerase sigma-70 factor, ECF subfamily